MISRSSTILTINLLFIDCFSSRVNPNCKLSTRIKPPLFLISTPQEDYMCRTQQESESRQPWNNSTDTTSARLWQTQTAFVQIHVEFLRFTKDWQAGRRSKCGNIPVYEVHLSEHLNTSITAAEEGGLQGASCCSLTKKQIGAVFCQAEIFITAGIHL